MGRSNIRVSTVRVNYNEGILISNTSGNRQLVVTSLKRSLNSVCVGESASNKLKDIRRVISCLRSAAVLINNVMYCGRSSCGAAFAAAVGSRQLANTARDRLRGESAGQL